MAIGLVVAGAVGSGQNAVASSFSFNFDTIVTGDTPSGSLLATLIIADAGANSVLVTLNHNSTSAAGQFITDLWFNVSPFLVPTQSGQTPSNKFQGGISAIQNGVGSAGIDFDLRQQFENSGSGGGINRLKPGESISFTLSGTGLDATDFLSLSGGNRTDLFAMIHLQGIPGASSVKLGTTTLVPEPASMVALGLGAMALIARKRRRK
ncbi:MAG: PEP-CTERM sorting domain-containing protein [Chlorobia bacterium]|nr:PEP-CTERM sorting domain-containing protein [Fimbriimonadaceae bacterium]